MKKENGRVDKMKKSKKDTCKRLIMFALALALLLSAPAASVQAASSTDKKLKKQADIIVKKQVKDKDSKKKKLEKLFQYAEKKYGYGRAYEFKAKKGWEKTYALEMFKKKKGSCYHFAAAYAVLAKKATNYTVRIGVGKTNGFHKKITQDHAWVEIKIKDKWYICDPNMDKFAAKSSGKYFLKERSKLKKVYNKYKKVKYTTVKL